MAPYLAYSMIDQILYTNIALYLFFFLSVAFISLSKISDSSYDAFSWTHT